MLISKTVLIGLGLLIIAGCSPGQNRDTSTARGTLLEVSGVERQPDEDLCDPSLQLLPCPRSYTDEELRTAVPEGIGWYWGGIDSFDAEQVERDEHPFLAHVNFDGWFRDPWVFDAASQVFACYGDMVCYHFELGLREQFTVQCDRLEQNSFLCWREYGDTNPETSNLAMACTSLLFLNEEFDRERYHSLDFFVECAPLQMN